MMEGEWKGGSEGGYYKLREDWAEGGRVFQREGGRVEGRNGGCGGGHYNGREEWVEGGRERGRVFQREGGRERDVITKGGRQGGREEGRKGGWDRWVER